MLDIITEYGWLPEKANIAHRIGWWKEMRCLALNYISIKRLTQLMLTLPRACHHSYPYRKTMARWWILAGMTTKIFLLLIFNKRMWIRVHTDLSVWVLVKKNYPTSAALSIPLMLGARDYRPSRWLKSPATRLPCVQYTCPWYVD